MVPQSNNYMTSFQVDTIPGLDYWTGLLTQIAINVSFSVRQELKVTILKLFPIACSWHLC